MATIDLLLVDDEEEFLTAAGTRLEMRGANPFTATNGVDALEILDKRRIDVVILDVQMPGKGGIEILREIKARHPLVEVIMLTGHASVETAVEGLKLGAFDYVTKPCDVSDLMGKVNKAVAKRKAMAEKIRQAKVKRIISHPMAVFDDDESAY